MPCDSVTTQSINLANAVGSILSDSLFASGWTIISGTETRIVASKDFEDLTWTKGQGLEITSDRAESVVNNDCGVVIFIDAELERCKSFAVPTILHVVDHDGIHRRGVD